VNLRKAYLAYAGFSGSIPESIGNLKNLRLLELQGNQLTGPIPKSIGNIGSAHSEIVDIWLGGNSLNGTIPVEISYIKTLRFLVLDQNKFTGQIPPEIGNLKNLTWLTLGGNTNLTGTLRLDKVCSNAAYQIMTTGTNVTVCGCASQYSTPGIFSLQSLECAASSTGSPLQKRALAFSMVIESSKLTCSTSETNGNPYQDCLNAVGAICNPSYMGSNATRVSYCKDGTNKISQVLSPLWQAVRRECGQWRWTDGFIGNKASSGCVTANSNLIKYAYYMSPEGTKVYVTSSLTNSLMANLWSNTKLNG